MKIGRYELAAVLDGTGRVNAAEVLHRDGTHNPWAAHRDLLDSNSDLVLAVGEACANVVEHA